MFLLRVAKYFEKKYNLFSYAGKDVSNLNIEAMLGLLSNLIRDIEKTDFNEDVLRKTDREIRASNSVSDENVKAIEGIYNKYRLIKNIIGEIDSSEIPEINKIWHRTFTAASGGTVPGKGKLLTVEQKIGEIADKLSLCLSSVKENNLSSFKRIFEDFFSDSRSRKTVIGQVSSIIDQFIKDERMTHSHFEEWVGDSDSDIPQDTGNNTDSDSDSEPDPEGTSDANGVRDDTLTLNYNGAPFLTIFFPSKNTKKSFMQGFPKDPPMSEELADFFGKNAKIRADVIYNIGFNKRNPKQMEKYLKELEKRYGINYDDLKTYVDLKRDDMRFGRVNLTRTKKVDGEKDYLSKDLIDAEEIKGLVDKCISEIHQYIDGWEKVTGGRVKNNHALMNVMRIISTFQKSIDSSSSGLVSLGLVYKYLYKILSKVIFTLKDRDKVINEDFSSGFADKIYSMERVLHSRCKDVASHYVMEGGGEDSAVQKSMARGVVVWHDPDTIRYRKEGGLLAGDVKGLAKKERKPSENKESLRWTEIDAKDPARVHFLGNQRRYNKSREQIEKDRDGDFEADQDLTHIGNELLKHQVSQEEFERYKHIKHPVQVTLVDYIGQLLDKGQRYLAVTKNNFHTSMIPSLQLALEPYVKDSGPITESDQKKLFLEGMPKGSAYEPGSYGFELARQMKGYNQILAEVCSETKPSISKEEIMRADKRYTKYEWGVVLPKVEERMRDMYSKITNLAEERSMMRDDLAWIKKKQQLENSDNKDDKDQ